MKRIWKTAFAWLRPFIGAGILLFILHNINQSSIRVDFRLGEPAETTAGSVYVLAGPGVTNKVTVLDVRDKGMLLEGLPEIRDEEAIPSSGVLEIKEGSGPERIPYSSTRITRGIRLLLGAFGSALEHPVLLAAALLCFFGCLCACSLRWRLILRAQGIELTAARAWVLYFIGHFFNAFMFGATGGDLIKAVYVSRETGHRKAEAVSTVFIDRVVGLFALILLATAVMLSRLRFFLADPKTEYALYFLALLTAGAVLVYIVMLIVNRMGGMRSFLGKAGRTPFGMLFIRIYNSFYICLTHPSLLARTLGLSIVNHLMLIAMMTFLGEALLVDLRFIDYLSLGPPITAIGSIPITPGGLGLREFAAITYLGIAGVTATKAFALSLLLYAGMVFWSLFGGVVFLFYGGTPQYLSGDEEENPVLSAPEAEDPDRGRP
ncbi:MAG: lysylphosphatidylglycerol synthase transmembrane domain-containing protein [Kiritimatiellia bacterium]